MEETTQKVQEILKQIDSNLMIEDEDIFNSEKI